ncbi:hypothetical protein [Streptomyces sp. SID3343]|uniref:PH-like domain-containing protein n=1 Tax=Streptomyces sp. SID3343 TaxID=2690260 RepID=UPI00137112CD|nr:hypothetical protein [Streptomyces sp. SID3343]MYV98894.1 hypothetical protein [Streptomyces sp. SID3343]
MAHPELLLAAEQKSAQVTDWGSRILWIGICLAFVLAVYLLMWRAWNKRVKRQAGLPALPLAPAEGGPPLLPQLSGRYFASTTAGDWLDRIAAHGLGTRSPVDLTLRADGLVVERPAAADFFIPVAALTGARHEKGIAGKVLPEGGLMVVTWRHGDTTLDSGFRSDHPADHDAWIEALTRLIAGDTPAGIAAGTENHADRNHQEGSVK